MSPEAKNNWQSQESINFMEQLAAMLHPLSEENREAFREGYRSGMQDPDAGEKSSILGKYRETSPEVYAKSCNDFGGTYHGDDIRKIREQSYSQGFYDCEMAYGPDANEKLLEECEKALTDAKEAYEDSYDGEEITPDWYVNLDLVIEKLKAARG